MDNSQTLELQIKSKAQEAKASVESLVKSLTNVENVLTNIYLELGSIEKKAESSINKTTTNATKNVNQLKQSTDKATSSADKLGNAFKKIFTFAGVKRLTTTALGWMNEAVDYTEQLNLFNVVFDNTEKNGKQMFSELGKSALQFQYKLNEAFGTNKTQTLYMQGIFESMGETVGIEDKYSSIMSETMTKLTYDLASLYNKTEKTTAEAIRAGVYAGQTKPLRSYGIDVTQSSLQPIAESLGITESVKNMSQAEKEILRYLATMKQAQIAMGDFANTVESPSNQLKIFRQQLVEAKVALSSLFIGTFSKILPYANAILMVIKEVSKAIADMFGIELKDYNSGIASQEGIYDGIADSADDASKAVKELKRQTLGFDEIHNINENNNSGSGTSVSGGIDQRLLDAITGYDNGMDKVRMKATEIRDRIMEWLGFTKEIDPLTGEVNFKLKDGETRFKKIMDFAKKIKDVVTFALDHADIIIKTIIGYKLIKKLGEIFTNLKNIKNVIKTIAGTNFGKLSIAVAGGLGLAELVSKTDWYKQFTDGKDLFESWDYIFSTASQVDAQNKANLENLGLSYMKQIAMYEKALKDGNTELANMIHNSIKDYKNIFSDEELKAVIKAYQENKDLINQMVFGESLFSDKGINITSYTDAFKEYVGTITGNLASIESYTELIERNDTAYKNANESMGILIAQMNTDQYSVTADDISKINSSLETMRTASENSGQATVDAITKIVLKYKEQGIMSDELTQQIITDAKKQQLAEQGYTEDYINKIVDLDEKLKHGKITQEQYVKELTNMYNEFNNTADLVSKKKVVFENLAGNVDLSAQSYDELESSINLASNTYEAGMQEIETTSKNNLDVISEHAAKMKREYGEESEEYKRAAEAIKAVNQSKASSMKELKDSYATYLNNILTNLVNSKEFGSKESYELYDKINANLSKLGYGVDSDVRKNLEGVKNELKLNGVKLGSGLSADTTKATSVVNQLIEKIQKPFKKLGININLSTLFKKNGGIFSGNSWKDIPQYENGGAPSHGSLVFAGENGPEILGNANGKTEILNKSQIASSIYSAVFSAMSQFNGGGIAEINVHADEGIIVDTAINGINQKTKQTGVCPVNIPTY
jgi:hypothetical protein